MCASSRTDLSAVAKKYGKKGAKATAKALRKIGTKLPKTGEQLEGQLEEMLDMMPLADAAVMIAGFFAGYHSLTPMTMLMSGFKGFADTMKDVEHFAMDPPLRGLLGISEAEWHAALKKTYGLDYPLSDAEKAAVAGVNSYKLSMACIGLIESYMITRPGALAGVLNFIGQMAQATAEGIDAVIPG